MHGRRGGYAAAIGHGLGCFSCADCGGQPVLHLKTTCQLVSGRADRWRADVGLDRGASVNVNAPSGQDQPPPAPRLALSQSFRHGFAIAVFNPKIAAFFASLFSQYLAEDQSIGLYLAAASLAGVDMVVYLMVVLLATTQLAARLFTKFVGLNDLILGSILLGFGTTLLVQIWSFNLQFSHAILSP